jgi:hypothetical protein
VQVEVERMEDIWRGDADDWEMVLRLLPAGWREKARELGALRRYREFPDAAVLLRVLLIHLAEGCSLRETAVRAAEGNLPGGGVAFMRAIPALEKLELEDDEQIGVTIVKRALEEPLRLIASNAGHEDAVVVNKVRESKQPTFGFNAATEDYTDMIAAGILDPAKVTRSALQNAASIAGLMLTTEALIAEIPEENKANGVPAGGPPMY